MFILLYLLLAVFPLYFVVSLPEDAGLRSMLASVDAVYVLNLDRSPDRLARIGQQLSRLGVASFRRVRAVDGSLLSSTPNPTAGVLTYHFGGLSIRTWDVEELEGLEADEGPHAERVAITMSHLKAVCQAYRHNHNRVIVLEDDVSLAGGSEAMGAGDVQAVLDALPEGWEVLQLSTNIASPAVAQQLGGLWKTGHLAMKRDPCGSHWVQWGAYAYIVSREGMRTLLQRYWPEALSVGPEFVCDEQHDEQGGEATAIGLRGSFDLTATSNFFADYLLYRLPNVYVMTRPAILPPRDFSPTHEQKGRTVRLVDRARALHLSTFTEAEQQQQQRQQCSSIVFSGERGCKRHFIGSSPTPYIFRGNDACETVLGGEYTRNSAKCAFLTASLWDFSRLCEVQGGQEDEACDTCMVLSGFYQLVEVCESTGGAAQYCRDTIGHQDGACARLQEMWPGFISLRVDE